MLPPTISSILTETFVWNHTWSLSFIPARVGYTTRLDLSIPLWFPFPAPSVGLPCSQSSFIYSILLSLGLLPLFIRKTFSSLALLIPLFFLQRPLLFLKPQVAWSSSLISLSPCLLCVLPSENNFVLSEIFFLLRPAKLWHFLSILTSFFVLMNLGKKSWE